MIIGVPKERKTLEKRIAITPDGAHHLTERGHTVLIESGAGEGAHFSDSDFRDAGAKIVKTHEEVWKKSGLIVKVKEPHETEYQYFRPGLAIFDYLHLAGLPEVAKKLLKGNVTGIAYELVQQKDGRLPLLEPMSEVAGKLSVQIGSYFLLAQHGGRGVLLGGTVGVPPCKVTIVGAGVAGRAACEIALGMGADVSILDIDHRKLERIKLQFGDAPKTIFSNKASLVREASTADLLIGAVLIPGASAPKLITRQIIQAMQKGSVFVDISIDQGGCAETSSVTSLAEPVYTKDGVIHYCVPNMPAQTARTSTMALTAATLPYVTRLADMGIEAAIREDTEIKGALNTYRGKLTNKAVADSIGQKFVAAEAALTA